LPRRPDHEGAGGRSGGAGEGARRDAARGRARAHRGSQARRVGRHRGASHAVLLRAAGARRQPRVGGHVPEDPLGSTQAQAPAVKRLVVGITGASGSIYGIRLLEILQRYADVELHLVLSRSGKRTLVAETDWPVADVEALAHHRYDNADIGATIASGSFRTAGMIIAPCSL